MVRRYDGPVNASRRLMATRATLRTPGYQCSRHLGSRSALLRQDHPGHQTGPSYAKRKKAAEQAASVYARLAASVLY